MTPLRAAAIVLAAAAVSTGIIYAAFGHEARHTMRRRWMVALLLWSLACFGGLAFLCQPSLIR